MLFQEIGQVEIKGGQKFTAVGFEPHVRADGTTTQLVVLEARCAQCGEGFVCRWPAEATRPFAPVRRCQKHKAAGRRVRKLHAAAEVGVFD